MNIKLSGKSLCLFVVVDNAAISISDFGIALCDKVPISGTYSQMRYLAKDVYQAQDEIEPVQVDVKYVECDRVGREGRRGRERH